MTTIIIHLYIIKQMWLSLNAMKTCNTKQEPKEIENSFLHLDANLGILSQLKNQIAALYHNPTPTSQYFRMAWHRYLQCVGGQMLQGDTIRVGQESEQH